MDLDKITSRFIHNLLSREQLLQRSSSHVVSEVLSHNSGNLLIKHLLGVFRLLSLFLLCCRNFFFGLSKGFTEVNVHDLFCVAIFYQLYVLFIFLLPLRLFVNELFKFVSIFIVFDSITLRSNLCPVLVKDGLDKFVGDSRSGLRLLE